MKSYKQEEIEKKKRVIALKSSTQEEKESKEDSEDSDSGDMALLTKKFKKYLKYMKDHKRNFKKASSNLKGKEGWNNLFWVQETGTHEEWVSNEETVQKESIQGHLGW